MYTPAHFREDRLPVLNDAIHQARLATLVTLGDDGLDASHVPVVLDATTGPYGVIEGHLSRANPQWRSANPAAAALAIFTGPDAYITPSWYPAKQQTGRVVPTWNYVAVHAHGHMEFFDDSAQLLALVTRLTDRHEAGRPAPWAVSDAPDDYIQTLLKGVIGFRLRISRLEGKWKASQNRPSDDRAAVMQGLRESDTPMDAMMAKAMSEAK